MLTHLRCLLASMSRRDIIGKLIATRTSRNFALVSHPLTDAVVVVTLPISMSSHRSFTHTSPPGYRLNPLKGENKKTYKLFGISL